MGELALVHEQGRAVGLTNSATTQAKICSFELAHPNTYTMYELLELMKELVLQNQSSRGSLTQGNNKISNRNLNSIQLQ